MADLSSYIYIAANTVTAANVSATGNVVSNSAVSTTGNVTAGNIVSSGVANITGNITTANYFVGNLVGTTVSTTGNISAGNVIVNGQPTTYGVVNPDYIQAEKSASQTSVGINTDVTFNVTSTSSGISQTNGVFTLTAGKTYLLQADLCISNFSANTAYTWWSWVDSTTNAQLDTSNGSALATGSSGVAIPATWVGTNDQYAGTARLIYTPATNQTVKLRITDASGTCSILSIASKATITQLNPTIAVQATASGTVAATVVANTSPNGSTCSGGSNTAPGLTVLTVAIPTAGTWRLDAELRVDLGSGGYMAAAFYNNGTLIPGSEYWVAGGAQNKASGTGSGQYSGFMSYNVTTTGARTVTLGIWSTATTSVIDSGDGRTWMRATQLDSIFALNTLATMSLTGNITTSGNVSATGNVTAANFFGNGATLSNVATTFESFWTVPTGNSTQNFTVTSGNTYLMWVDCNIPNGILTWNATGTVTNTNVPVIGAQYAWVYTGGGTPIDFTSIPNQFVGTANTILRSSVAPSATTNRFDFGINNTSGNAVTVRYGWAQIS